MTRTHLRSGGHAWSDERVALGLSIRDLERLSGVNRGDLSRIEGGRLIPTSEQWNAVMAALRRTRDERREP